MHELSRKLSSDLYIPSPPGLDYFPFQKAGIEFCYLNKNHNTLIGDEPGCIGGESFVTINRAGKSFKIKLSILYEKFNDKIERKNHKWDLSIPTKIRCLFKGEFRSMPISKVYDKGFKETIRISFCGGHLDCTPDHEILTPKGYLAAEKLSIGDAITTNGLLSCRKCGSIEKVITSKGAKFLGLCKLCMYVSRKVRPKISIKNEIGTDGYPLITSKLFRHPNYRRSGLATHRLVYEAFLNGLSLHEWLETLETLTDPQLYRFLEAHEIIHHKNKIITDYNLENLKLLSVSEHHKTHNRHTNIPIFTPKTKIITNVRTMGKVRVFDVTVPKVDNFVVNSVVVHNCGKTIQFIGFCNLVGAMNILVVCPASLVLNWAREIRKWHVGNPTIEIISSGKQKLNPSIDVHIVSYSLTINQEVQAFLQRKKPDAMTIDEVHYLKNPAAKRTSAIYSSSGNIVDGASFVIALSGTPIINRPIEIFETVKKLCHKAIDYMEYEQFAMRYCAGYYDQLGFHDDGASNLKELGMKLRGDFMVRRKKIDVLLDLPDKTVQLVSLNQSPEARRLVKEMKRFDVEEIVRKRGVQVTFEGISEMRRELGVAKIPAVLKYIKNQLESGREKVVVFGHHREVLVLLAEGLEEYGSVLIYGGTPKMSRQGIVDRFQTDPKCRVFVGGIIPCGEGITLTASDYLCFAEPSWVPGQNHQVIDRVHRIGQLKGVLAEFLTYEESLDENILRSHSRKAIDITKVME